jgi:hypothetical protein
VCAVVVPRPIALVTTLDVSVKAVLHCSIVRKSTRPGGVEMFISQKMDA